MDGSGYLCRRGVTSSETNKFIELLFPGTSLSSRSCKCTALSWAAKYGLFLPDRNILGRHADATKDISAVYSRDLGVAAVRALQGVIDDICLGTFAPDETRRGYVPNLVIDADAVNHTAQTSKEVESQQWAKVELIEAKEDQDECIDLLSDDDGASKADGDFQRSESSSNETSSSESEVEVAPTQPKFIKVITSFKESHGIAYKHRCSKLVH